MKNKQKRIMNYDDALWEGARSAKLLEDKNANDITSKLVQITSIIAVLYIINIYIWFLVDQQIKYIYILK